MRELVVTDRRVILSRRKTRLRRQFIIKLRSLGLVLVRASSHRSRPVGTRVVSLASGIPMNSTAGRTRLIILSRFGCITTFASRARLMQIEPGMKLERPESRSRGRCTESDKRYPEIYRHSRPPREEPDYRLPLIADKLIQSTFSRAPMNVFIESQCRLFKEENSSRHVYEYLNS